MKVLMKVKAYMWPSNFKNEAYLGTYVQWRNEIVPFVEIWMDLETVIQSKVNQKEKNNCHILMHVCGI